MNRIKATLVCCLALTLAMTGLARAQQQGWATKTVRLVVPYQAGAITDLLARIVAEQLQKKSGQSVIVENQPGAGGMIGAANVSRAAPDGHTLVLHTPGWPAAKVFVKAPVIPVPEGLEPISLLAEGRLALVVSKPMPNTFQAFIAHLKASPDKYNYGSPGPSDLMLGLESLTVAYGLKVQSINYRGAAQTTPAIIANEVQYGLQPEFSSSRFAKEGKLKMLAVTGKVRTERNPEVPTFAELGHPDIRNNWFAVFAPPRTPAALIDRISSDLADIVRSPELAQRMKDFSLEPIGSTAADLRAHITATIREYEATAKAANIQPE